MKKILYFFLNIYVLLIIKLLYIFNKNVYIKNVNYSIGYNLIVYKRKNKIQKTKETFILEKKCLELLNMNYNCTCGENIKHFPKILKTYDKFNIFILTNNGYSFDNLNKKNKIKFKIKFNINIDNQLDCIISNLKYNKIYHEDMVPDGRNLCVDNNGVISLIDFNIASIKDYIDEQEYYLLKKRMKLIITPFINPDY